MSDEKLYEDFSDEDVAALAKEREAHRSGDKVKLAEGTYDVVVKVQRPIAETASGLFAGARQVLLGHVVVDEKGEEIPGTMLWNRQALPLAAPGCAMTSQAKGIALGNVITLGGGGDTEDATEEVKNALAFAGRALAGEEVFVGARCYVRLSRKPRTDPNGAGKFNEQLRLTKYLKKDETVTKLGE